MTLTASGRAFFFNPYPALFCPTFANSVDPDQMASGKPFDQDLHCLPCSLWTELEMCQYDTDALTQGHPHPHASILQKKKLKKGPLLS